MFSSSYSLGRERFFLRLEQVSALAEKLDNPEALANSLKDLKVEPEIIYLINLEQMCAHYHCLPKDLLEEDAYYLRAFTAILKGRSEGLQARK